MAINFEEFDKFDKLASDIYCGELIDKPINFEEFDKLVKLVEDAGIPHTVNDYFYGGKQIKVFNSDGSYLDDAVIHRYSHGTECGLLETFNLSDCEGFEEAEDIIEGWKKMYH